MSDIRPMLAQPGKRIDPSTLVGSHAFDLKLDGVRSLAYWDGTTLRLINRSGRDQTVAYPDLVASFPAHLVAGPVVFDGEIVAATGSFEDVARRDKVTKPHDVARAMAAHPVKYVAFDVLTLAGNDVRSLPWSARRMHLEFQLQGDPEMWETTVVSQNIGMLEKVRDLGLEGVIAKRMDSVYVAGRSGNWLKFKNTHRVTAIAVGYEPGEGSRAHFGAMFLALVDGETVVPIGRVGTGFNHADTLECKALLDGHTPFVVEIEAANRTKTNQLRFPVYKGIRSDLSVGDATMDQLDALPRS